MRPLPEHRPSWLSTILFALVVGVFFLCLGGGLAATAIPRPTFPEDLNQVTEAAYRRADEDRESLQFILMLGSGLIAAELSGLAWRSPDKLRFNITFFSGLSLLLVTFFHVRAVQNAAAEHDDKYEVRYAPVPGLVIALMSTTTALVLILTALNLDRQGQRRD